MDQPKFTPRRWWRRRDPTISFGVSMILLLWAGVALEVRREYASAQASMLRDASNYASVFKESALRSLKQVDTQLWFVSLQAGRRSSESWTSILRALPIDPELTVQVALIDHNGMMQASTASLDNPKKIDLSDREHVRVHLDGKVEGLFISKPLIGRASNKPSIQLSRAIKDTTGHVIGVAVASLDPKHLSRFFTNLELPKSSTVLLFGIDGIVRSGAGHGEKLVGQDISGSLVLAQVREGKRGSDHIEILPGAEPLTASWRRFKELPLGVAVGLVDSPDLDGARTWSKLLVTLATFLSFVIGAVSLRLANSRQQLMFSEMRLRRTQRQIEAQSIWLQTTVENITQGIAMIDPLGRIVVCNDKIRTMLRNGTGRTGDTTKAEIDHILTAAGIVTSGDVQPNPAQVPLIQSGTCTLGNSHILKVVCVAVPGQGMVVTLEDITERHLRQQQLLSAELAARSANRAKSQFLASMSHELRTPMNGVIGMAQILLEEENDPDRRKALGTIIASGEALMSIINDVLDFSRLEAGRLELRTSQFSIVQALEELVTLLSARAVERGIKITIEYAPDLPSHFHGDVGRLRQIVTNLLGNAVKFTTGQSVTLSAAGHRNGSTYELTLAVADTGPGIPPSKIPVIFEDFSQLDNTANFQNSGTGLGLPISRRLARLMGGRIDVSSEVGVGSTFTLTVPLEVVELAKPSEPSPDLDELYAEASARLAAGGRVRILAAEDNQANRQVLVAMLKNENVDVVLACDGQEAVDRFLELQPDIVLMDLKMPHVDGIEATSLIRTMERENGLARTPIVAISANAMRGDRQKCLDLDMDDYMSKPIKKKVLVRMIDKWVQDCPAHVRAEIAPWFADERRDHETAKAGSGKLVAAE